MRGTASFTAAWVAGWRGLGSLLGAQAIADDRFGARFGGTWARGLARAGRVEAVRRRLIAIPGVVHWVAYMQVRTRAIDDELLAFVAGGGRQVVILGAGYDCRAARFERELVGARVFEVDHPATQARKREILDGAGAAPAVAYVAWDFEQRPLAELPAVLSELGLDPAAPTLTIWEGVTMYLTEAAIEATLATVRELGGPGSALVFTYVERHNVERPRGRNRVMAAAVAALGEPFRFGWDPGALGDWLATRGFALRSDGRLSELAAAMLPPEIASRVHEQDRHVAIADRRADDASGLA